MVFGEYPANVHGLLDISLNSHDIFYSHAKQ